MNKELSVPLSSAAVSAPNLVSSILRKAGIVVCGSLLAAICAHVSIPLFFTPVPLSLTPLAVLVLGLLLTPRMAAFTFGAYLLEGAAGLPVFAPSPANPGLAHLFGPTGGYLLAYPLAAMLIALLWRRTGQSFASAVTCAAIGDLVILTSGALWLGAARSLPTLVIAKLAVLPFLPGDVLKIAAAAAIGVGVCKFRNRMARNA
jgi:biotin transport system substrate-specific component